MRGTSISPSISSDRTALTSQEAKFCAGVVSQEQEKVDEVREKGVEEKNIEEQHDAKGYDDLEKQVDTMIANSKPEAKDTYMVNIVLGGHMPLSRC